MKLYFGEISQELVDEAGYDMDEIISVGDKFFDFCVDATPEQVTIKDSLGRYVPFSHDDIPSLLRILKELKPYSKAIVKGEAAALELRYAD